MKKRQFELLLDQLKLQHEFAEYSLSKFISLYSEIKEKNPHYVIEVNDIEFWLLLREFATSLANIAKILVLPTKKEVSHTKESGFLNKKRKGRDILLQEIGLRDRLPVISDKLLRNSLEHIDERIDDYYKAGIKIAHNRSIIPNFFRKNKGSIRIDDKITEFKTTDYKENIFYDEKEVYYAAFGSDIPILKASKELRLLGKRMTEVKEKLDAGKLDDKFNL